jgi:shikimate kinase
MIFLVGFMGSGKSHWATRIAEHVGGQAVDLDTLIEQGEKSTVASIFEQKGEAHFRAVERAYLHRTVQLEGISVVATGGGTPCFFDNMDWMNQRGMTVFLKNNLPTLATRLWPERAMRPLLRDVQLVDFQFFIEKKYLERLPTYEQAHLHINPELYAETDFLTNIAAALAAFERMPPT